MSSSRDEVLDGSPYQAYLYAYPHKTAYRSLAPSVPLADVWSNERRDALFLYVHVPFCEMRCGFCNLFTSARPGHGAVAAFLDALDRQAKRVREALGDGQFARFAMGGGTPTHLDVDELARVLDLVSRTMGTDLGAIPASVEVSPSTVDETKLALLRERGVDRISIGVQSFVESESNAAGRPQSNGDVWEALDAIRAAGFPTLNVDLIYGLREQTIESFLLSLRTALRHRPEELYLYPLYVRPLTGLGRSGWSWDDHRLSLYRAACDYLAAEGYEQVSMRMFRARHARTQDGPVYCVQDDGMIGLGAGARSYTHTLHYSSEYAVSARGVRAVLDAWVTRDDAAFAVADHGIALDDDEQRRRWLSLGLLADGVDLGAYRGRFQSELFDDLPQLGALLERGLAIRTPDRLTLTSAGLERADAIGPWLVSPAVRARMESNELR